MSTTIAKHQQLLTGFIEVHQRPASTVHHSTLRFFPTVRRSSCTFDSCESRLHYNAGSDTVCAGDITDMAQQCVSEATETAEQLHTCKCNDSQAKAVVAAASQMLTLIHGPPGTGKVQPQKLS